MRHIKLFESFDSTDGIESISDIILEYIEDGNVIDRSNEYCDMIECETDEIFEVVNNRLESFNITGMLYSKVNYCNNDGELYPTASMSDRYKVTGRTFITIPSDDMLSVLHNRFDNLKYVRDAKGKISVYYNNEGLAIYHRESVNCHYVNGEIFHELDQYKLNYTQKQILLKGYIETILGIKVNSLLDLASADSLAKQFGINTNKSD